MTDASADVPYEKLANQLQTLAGQGYKNGAPAVAAGKIRELAALLSSLEPDVLWPQSAARALDRAIAGLGTQRYLATRLEKAYVARVFIGKLPGRVRLDPEPGRDYDQRIGSLRVETGLEEKGDSTRNSQRYLTGIIKKILITELLALAPAVTILERPHSDAACHDFVRREAEEDQLRTALTDDTRRAVWVTGEVGVGKSRFIRHLLADIFGDNARVVRCSSADRYRSDLARAMRYLTGQHYEDSIALLEEAATSYLHSEKSSSTLIYLDGLDSIAADDILTNPQGIAGRLVVSSRLPPPPEVAPDFKILRLSDMREHEAISLTRNLASIFSELDVERIATVLHYRPAAIDLATRYLMQHRETNLDEFLQDLLLPDHALAMLEYVSSPASERLANVYVNSIQSLTDDSDALLVLDALTCCLPGMVYPKSVLSAIWAFATEAPLIADQMEDEKLCALFRSKGSIIHHALRPSRRLTQYDSMRLSAKLAKLEALGLIANDEAGYIMSSYAQQIVAFCRMEHFGKNRLLILDAFLEALRCCGWRPGESLPKLLTEWTMRLPLPDTTFSAERSDEVSLLHALALRADRQLRLNLDSFLAPLRAAWDRDFVDDILANLVPDVEMSSDPGRLAYVIEVVRLLASQGQTIEAGEIVDSIDEYGRQPFDHERMIASELSSCSLVDSAEYIEHYRRRSIDLKSKYDQYDAATQVKHEGGLELPKELFACARVASFDGEFVTSADLYLRSAKAFHAVGGSLAAIAGEYRARAGAVDSLLRAGEFTAASNMGDSIRQLFEWHQNEVWPVFPQFEPQDEAVKCARGDTSHELGIRYEAHEGYRLNNIISATVHQGLSERLNHCRHLASLELEHGTTVQHAEQLSRQALVSRTIELRICVYAVRSRPDEVIVPKLPVELLQSSNWLTELAQRLREEGCWFGYRQLNFNLRLHELASLACLSALSLHIPDFLELPVSEVVEGVASANDLSFDPEKVPSGTYGANLITQDLVSTAESFTELASLFRSSDASKYWEAKALAVAACCEISGIAGLKSGDSTIVSHGRAAASRMKRADWDVAIRESEHDLLRALILFAVL